MEARYNLWGRRGGLTFSDRAVTPNEVLSIEARNLSLIVGYVACDPSELMNTQPKPKSWLEIKPSLILFSMQIPKKRKQHGNSALIVVTPR